MAEVFKTNISEVELAKALISKLLAYFPGSRINFDLEDHDNILRAEGNDICPKKIIEIMHSNGYECLLLE